MNLAFCYELGFGVRRDIVKCTRTLLSTHNISVRDLENEIEQAKKITQLPEFQNGVFRRFLEQGHFNAFDLSRQYREEQRSREAESRYQEEVETMGSILGEDHLLVQELRRQLSLLMSSEGRWKDAEKLQVRMIEFGEGVANGGQYTEDFTPYLAATYSHLGRWKEAEELEVQVMEASKRVFGVEHLNTLTSIGKLASIYKKQRRWKEAEELEMQAMQTINRLN